MNDVSNFSGFLTRPSPMSASFLVLSVGNFDQFLTPSSPPSSPSQMPTSFMDGPLRSQAFRRIMKYLNNSWQSYIVKTRKGNWKTEKLKNSQILFFIKKRQDLVAANFSSTPLPFFQQLILYCARHFFVQTTSGYYVFFLKPSKTEKFIHPWFWLSL